MNDRAPKRLDQLGSVARGKSRHRPRNDPALYGGRWPFFQTGDVKAAELYLHSFSQTYNDAGLAQSKLWPAGTLCITIAANIADTAILGIPGCFPDSVVGFIVDPAQADARFVKYYIETLKRGMQNASRGTTQDNLSVDKLLTFELLVPSAQRQRDIASILSAYDDLIENNMGRIAILEEVARRIYEEWFVRFRFPDHEGVRMVESESGLVPEGWRLLTLGELVEFQKGKKPAAVFAEWAPGRAPALLIDALRGGSIEFADADRLVSVTRSDTIMVMDGSGSAQVFIGHEGVIGSTLGRYRGTKGAPVGAFWLYLLFLTRQADIGGKNIGAAIPHANKDYIRSMPVPAPPARVAARFEQVVEPMFDLIQNLKAKISTLRTTRDLLLPKLISGELDVSAMPEPEALAA